MLDDLQESMRLDVLEDVLLVEPTNFVKCRPKFASLVDIDLACLLSVGLSKLLLDVVSLDSLDEDSAFRSQVGGAVEAEIGGKVNFVWVEEVGVRVGSKVDRSTFPVDLERIGFARKSGERWAVVRQGAEVLVFPSNSLCCIRC